VSRPPSPARRLTLRLLALVSATLLILTGAISASAHGSGSSSLKETKRDADVTWIQRGHITVVPINWDRTYGKRTDSRTQALVRSFVEHKGPRP